MANDEKLSGLTRSLLLGVSLGTVALTQVGCVPTTTPAASTTTTAGGGARIAVGSAAERQLCSAALQSRSASDANRLLQSFPESRCIAPLLSALPASTLANISPAAVDGLGASVIAALPPRVRAGLPCTPGNAAGTCTVVAEQNTRRY